MSNKKYHNIAVRPEVFEVIREHAHKLRLPLGNAVALMMQLKYFKEIALRIERSEGNRK